MKYLILILAIFSLSVFGNMTEHFHTSQIIHKNINYLIYKPEVNLTKYPLLVFLHGVGEKAKSESPLDYDDIQALKKHGPMKLIKNNEWDPRYPFIVTSIQCYKGCKFHSPEIVNEVIGQIQKSHSVDNKRIYLTGISMGGNGVMRYLARYPKKIAAAVPIAGWGEGNYCAFNNTAFWAIHHRGDDIVNVSGSINAYNAISNCYGRNAEHTITILEKDGHDSWTDTYNLKNNLDIYSFLLKNSL